MKIKFVKKNILKYIKYWKKYEGINKLSTGVNIMFWKKQKMGKQIGSSLLST